MNHSIAVVIFIWAVFALCAYRIQRLVTDDQWPPTRGFRIWLKKTFGVPDPESDKVWTKAEITEFFTCPWCFGSICTFVLGVLHQLFVADFLTGRIRHPNLLIAEMVVAAAAVVGQIGQRD